VSLWGVGIAWKIERMQEAMHSVLKSLKNVVRQAGRGCAMEAVFATEAIPEFLLYGTYHCT
jgi:hypothetical protein